jgi:DNA-binding response OmpR family regulator
MKILVADDDEVLRLRLQSLLSKRGFEVIEAADGESAWITLQQPDAPRLAILDWMMAPTDGLELCRRIRAAEHLKAMYLILLTARESKQHVIEGLRAGANDYVTKPFDPEELHARVAVGVQVIQLQAELAARVRELEEALARVNQLQGLLPICVYCKSIRDDHDYWHRVENYIANHSSAQFSHGICPECYEKIMVPELQRLEQEAQDEEA